MISAVSNAEVRTDDNDMMLVLDIFTPFGRDCNCRLSFRDKLIMGTSLQIHQRGMCAK